MLGGSTPYNASEPRSIMYQIVHEPFPDLTELNPEVPADVLALIYKMTSKREEDRHSSVHELCGRFGQFCYHKQMCQDRNHQKT